MYILEARGDNEVCPSWRWEGNKGGLLELPQHTTCEAVWGNLTLNTKKDVKRSAVILPPSNNTNILQSFLPVFLLGILYL